MLVDLHGKIKALFISFNLYICFIVFVSLFLLCFFVHILTVSYVYKTLKMPAHWCIYKLMFYINLIKYLFYISEYKVMLIQLLICYYIYIYIHTQYNKKYR